MRRTKLFSLLGGLAALAFAPSCDRFLDPNPSDVLAPESFYKTSADAVAAVNGIYAQAKGPYSLAFWYLSDVATDDIIAAPRFGADGHRMSNYTFDATEWPLAEYGVWGGFYGLINQANAVLDRVPAITMDVSLRTRLLGEAHFLRALTYFNLVRFFGDVPLLDHEVKSVKGLAVSRTPVADVYALIVSDLRGAAAALPASYTGANVGRATRGAALALLTKVYLTRQDWTNAAQTAGEIFEINYDGVLDPGAGSVHTLFSIPYSYPGGEGYGLMYITPSLQRLYDSTDTRGDNGTFMTKPHIDQLGQTVSWVDPPGAAFNKYLDETDFQNMHTRDWQKQSNNWIVLRYADVLLMYAEAVNEGGPAASMTAEQALNAVRVRAGIPPVLGLSQTAFRDAVRLDRRREFVFEGQRWFDLARWGVLNAAILAKTAEVRTIDSLETGVHGVKGDLFPIPQSERDINHNLTQNPGW
jgi:starch-binding outer membrane protein, SusD/RagB family